MTAERPQTESPEQVFIISRNGQSPEKFRNLGLAALAGGFGVESRPIGDVSANPEQQPQPVYAEETDFINAARELTKSSSTGVKAWNTLTRDYIIAHNSQSEPLVQFGTHPPVEGRWDHRAIVTDVDVRTLAAVVDKVHELINGKTPAAATKILKKRLPPGAGIDAFNIWQEVVRTKLPPEETA
ncbi:MAG TPA: hypothetical protein VLF43_03080 [Candidatus Saccharimonadales bacterium]|nr:hypothetical protein [Candidatus Saccharimonadales bacterium]